MHTLETQVDVWGIEAGFIDAFERWHDTPEATRLALRSAMGQEPLEIAEHWIPDAPEPCPEPARAWGWTVQVYALRSQGSWGIGDLADLRRLGQWSAARGAGFVQISPLGAMQAVPPLEPSPYYPSSRRYLSPLFLRIEEIPGAQRAAARWAPLAERGHALNGAALIDRDAVFALKMEALEGLWAEFKAGAPEREDFARFVVESGQSLREYAIHCVLTENLGPNWKEWPPAYRHPAAPAVAYFAAEHLERIAFHEWIQWLLDLQLDEANQALHLVQDLPIGFDPGGADAWVWQDLLAFGASVGAPPDLFNARGQDWGLPPFIPHRLQAAGYGPIRETIRALLKHAGGLRIDHVMGLFHLYWIPKSMDPDGGAYVRYDQEELLSVIAEECRRTGAFAVGEELGTVDPWVRERLKAWGLLGSKVLWFESDPPGDWPRAALASVSTYDLPTLAGHHLLARSPALLVAASLEDALGVTVRPNLPGTIHERPNWRMPLPKTLEELEKDPAAMALAAALARGPQPR